MEGANNQTIITDVKGAVVTTLNGAALSTAVGSPFGAGTAAYFDGTNDYATTPAQAGFVFGSGDFAVEAFCYIAGNSPTDGGGNREACIAANYQSSGGWALVLAGNGSTTGTGMYLSYWNGSSWTTIISVTTTVSQGAWHYIMAKRVGTATQLWLDGASVATGTNSTNMSLGQLMNFGGVSAHTSYQKWLNGYIAQVRITKSVGRTVTAAPTAPFPRPTISGITYTPAGVPTAKTVLVAKRSSQVLLGGANSDPSTGAYSFNPPDFSECTVYVIDEVANPYWSNALFASKLNASGFPTLTGQTLTVTGTVTASTAVADPFVGAQPSALFNGGTGDYLVSSGTLLPGTIYTVSGWFRTTSLSNPQGIFFFGTNGSDNNRVQFAVDNTGLVNFFGYSTGNLFNISSAAGVIAINTWYHFAAVRNGTNVYAFIDGVLVASGVVSGTESTGSTLHLGYCRYGAANRGLPGRLFDVRYSNRAEYLAPFTPPAAFLPAAFVDGNSSAGFAEIRDRVVPG